MLKWFACLEGMREERLVKKLHEMNVEVIGGGGRPGEGRIWK